MESFETALALTEAIYYIKVNENFIYGPDGHFFMFKLFFSDMVWGEKLASNMWLILYVISVL